MIGGYQILDLRKISLELSSDTQTFTDVDILKQLRNLRDYIEKGHDYSKALNKAMKDIKIRYRDGKLGEKIEVCEHAGIYCSNDSLTYELKTKNLMIEVVFEEKTDDDGNKYYDIKTAKYIYSEDEIIGGDLKVGGDITVEGDAEVDDLQVNSDTTMDGDLSVGGDLVVTGKINDESNPSVKPIYWHGLEFVNTVGASAIVYGHILNNSSDEINSFAKFITWITSFTNSVYFQCHGVIQYEDATRNILCIYKRSNENTINFILEAPTGYTVVSNVSLSTFFSGLSDGVNKIN